MNRKHTAMLVACLGLLVVASTASAAGKRDRFDRADALRSGAATTPVVDGLTQGGDADQRDALARRSPTAPSNPVLAPIVTPVAEGESQILRGLALSRVTWEQELTTAKPLFRRAQYHVQKFTLADDVEDLDSGRLDGPARKANYAIQQLRALDDESRN